MNSYDEDLEANPFYKVLLGYEADLENASNKKWIICIPRNGSIKEPITQIDISNHILIPNGTVGQYITLTNLVVNFTKKGLEVLGREDSHSPIHILFSETFYHKDLKYKVHCIEVPLARPCIPANTVLHIVNLRDCIDFLWIETSGCEVFHKITQICQVFLQQKSFKNPSHLEAFKINVERLYHQCMLVPLEYNGLFVKTETDFLFWNKVSLATETFMQHTLENHVFEIICALTSHQDSNFNKATRNLHAIQIRHLPIADYQDRIPIARCELGKINQCTTTLGKLECLRMTFDILARGAAKECSVLNGQVLVELFAFLIVKLHINNWIANLIYVKEFMFSHCKQADEASYLITTLEVAIGYVKSGQLIPKLNIDIDDNPHDVVVAIRTCNLSQLKALSERQIETSLGVTNIECKLCHPLCSCHRCEVLLSHARNRDEGCFDCVDDKGRSALHIACIYGYPQIVDFLLHLDSISFEFADYSGSYAVHYAAQCGHLNSLLLLLHNDANLNITNADGNTALHLAANNGHENCVKGLLYYAEHQRNTLDIDLSNCWGDTALHLAAKWGYINIVNILLEYKIDHCIRNKRNKLAVDLAHNLSVKKLLMAYSTQYDGINNLHSVNSFKESKTDLNAEESKVKTFGIRPNNFEQFKKAQLVLKAIENNDLPLTCFYLGIPTSGVDENNSQFTQSYHCHPLCDCSLCHTKKQRLKTSLSQQDKLNINICNSEGFTPLHVAAQYGRNEILRLLLDAGADCRLHTFKECHTPLHLACINQRLHALKELLLSESCDADARDSSGSTALHYACSKNNLPIVDLLLSKATDATLMNNRGITALHLAQEGSYFAVCKLIQEKTKHSS